MYEDLFTTTSIVKSILETDVAARNSDNYLFVRVCSYIGKRNGVDINKMSMPALFLHLKQYGFPQFESVRRTRQKIQAENPELAGDNTVEGYRLQNEDSFRDYARH